MIGSPGKGNMARVSEGEPHLVIMRQDGCDLAAGEGDILARKLIDSPGSWIEGMVECKEST